MDNIDPNIIELFRDLIYKKLGIHLSEDKNYILESKLNKILLKNRYKDLKDFYNSIINGNKQSYETLVQYITTTHTFFFREKEHLDTLVKLIKISKKDYFIIWSAASSTGEEVYSIIISLIEAGIYNFMIVASDINKEVLYKMKEGIYSADRLKGVSEDIKNRYFTRISEQNYKVNEKLKKYTIIKKINLIEEFFLEQKVDYIFCRNVMIYFDIETRKKVVNNLLNNLADDGFLFIGHSENLFNITNRVESVFVSVYNKK